MAIAVWNYLGGLKWEGLELAVERFGVTDVEQLIDLLVLIRQRERGSED